MQERPERSGDPIDRPIYWEPSLAFLKYAIGFILAGSAGFAIAMRIFAPDQLVRSLVGALFMLVAGIAWFLLERRHTRAAALTLGIGAWAYVTTVSVLFGGVNGSSIIVYPLVILLTGWLASERAGMALALLTAAVTGGLALAETWGLSSVPVSTPPGARWVVQACVFMITALLITHVVRSYRNRLNEVNALGRDLARRTAEVQAREADLNRAQAVAKVGSWAYNVAGDLMRLSPETCRIYGLVDGMTLSHDGYLSRIHPEDRGAVDGAWRAALKGGKPYDHEHRILAGERMRWVRETAELEFDAGGAPLRGVGITQDISERERHQAEILAARNQLAATLEAIPDLMFEMGLDGCYHSCYAPRGELLAAPVSELIGNTVSDKLPAAAAAVCMAALREAHETGRSHGRQFELLLPQGRRWFELSVSRKPVEPGREPRFIVLSREITLRKQAEEALRASEVQLHGILGSTADGILAVDRDGRVIRTNRRFADLWRIPQELLDGKDEQALLDHVVGQLADPQDFLDNVRALYQSDAETTDRINFKDGRVFERFTSSLKSGGSNVGRVWSFRDVTEQRRAGGALRESEAKYRELVSNANAIILRLAPDGTVTYFNEFAERFFGYASAEILGKHVVGTIVPEQESSTKRDLSQLISDILSDPRKYETNENENITRDGRRVVVRWANRVMLDEQQRPVGVLCIGHDITERRQAEAALVESRNLLQTVIDTAPVRVFWKDRDLRYLGCNPAFARDAGKGGPDEVVGKDDFQMAWANQAEHYRADDLAVMHSGVSKLAYDEPQTTPEGRTIWLRTSKVPLRNRDGETIGVMGVYEDITERRRVEQRLGMAIDVTQVVFWEIDFQADRLSYDRAMLPTLGLEADGAPVSLSGWIEQVHPEDRGGLQQRLAQALLPGDRAFDFEYRMPGKAGATQWIHSWGRVVERDAGGQPAHAVGTSMNITERKRAEASLRESENRLSAVFHASPIGISITRLADGKILDANEAALRMYGYGRDEALGRTVLELRVYEDSAQREEVVRQLREQGKVDRYPVTLRKRSGEACMTEVSVRVTELQGEQYLISMMLDVTERKRLEDVHLQAQKLESLGTLAGGIAHDFNNILSAIRGNADLAAEDVGPDHLAAESLAEIRKSTARASELVRRIMAFGRPKEVKHEVVDLGVVVNEVLRLLRSTMPAGIAMSTAFAQDAPHVIADSGQVHEAIVNLTTNAAHAIGPRAGTIEYALEAVQAGEVLARSVPGLKPGRYARLTVTDNGCGMDAAMQERIFDAFYTSKAVGEGTGLGLSMVHGIMRSHGGAVTVESVLGKGSSFALYFPAVDDKAENAAEGIVSLGQASAGRRVLYVDDEEALVFLAKRVLTRLGHMISSFTDPEEALAAFRAHPRDFNVVVTDLSMPHLSGFDLAREILALRPELPVLMTTGYVRPEDEAEARAIGIRKVIFKPVTINELGVVLDQLFRADDLGAAPAI